MEKTSALARSEYAATEPIRGPPVAVGGDCSLTSATRGAAEPRGLDGVFSPCVDLGEAELLTAVGSAPVVPLNVV